MLVIVAALPVIILNVFNLTSMSHRHAVYAEPVLNMFKGFTASQGNRT